jgi:hypothetical protein
MTCTGVITTRVTTWTSSYAGTTRPKSTMNTPQFWAIEANLAEAPSD